MTSSFSLLTSFFIYFVFQFFIQFRPDTEERTTSATKKSNVGSKVIYLIGVLLFMYRFERQPWRQKIQPLRLIFDVISVLLAFEFLYRFLWLRLEFFFLDIVPTAMVDALKSCGVSSQIPAWPFVVPLYVISGLFLVFAHNSDIYIDHYLQLDGASYDNESDGDYDTLNYIFNSDMSMTQHGFGEPVGRVQSPSFPSVRTDHTPVTGAPPRERGTHTMTDKLIRRSDRLRHRTTSVTDH